MWNLREGGCGETPFQHAKCLKSFLPDMRPPYAGRIICILEINVIIVLQEIDIKSCWIDV